MIRVFTKLTDIILEQVRLQRGRYRLVCSCVVELLVGGGGEAAAFFSCFFEEVFLKFCNYLFFC